MPKTLGERLAQARREMGVREHRDVSRLELAKAADVDSSMISQYESGAKVPREDTLAKLAAFLGVTPAFLRYGVGNAQTPAGEAGAFHFKPDPEKDRALTAEEIQRARDARNASQIAKTPTAKKSRKANGGRG